MMILLTALLTVGFIIAAPSPADPQGTERHSGTVASVDPATRTLVLEELVEEGRPRRLQVRVPEGAPVMFSERLPDEQAMQQDTAFAERPIELADVRPGDFVVVEGAARADAATASAVVVTMRPGEAQASPAASPGARSRP